MQTLSLQTLANELLERAASTAGGRAAQTAFGGHENVLRQTVLALVQGAALAEHANPGEATICVLVGHVSLTSGDETQQGRTGDLLIIPDAPHSLTALEDSAILLTVAKRP